MITLGVIHLGRIPRNPEDGNYQIDGDSVFRIFNTTTGKYHSVWITSEGNGDNPTLNISEEPNV